ncbi:hypothetical protein GCK72_019518 [Caenorhabditis remanei]|uniref:Uncharacterized protein n=1 Tax=Caenorhabditis remanei TaxID=31234 RepID=A0A6A5GE62_CAERE|nr:hypothetical protein GCK72_019518 [Caenorhabditis remanei]KAF1752963.1 hypothetical protein GCK72_019518 [Caenorhabditis remanei]
MTNETEGADNDVAEPTVSDMKSRFLKRRSKQNSESEYHPSHKKRSLAIIPDHVEGVSSEDDREYLVMASPTEQLDERDLSRLKQATTHLPDDVVLQVLSFYEYDVDTTINVTQQMHSPDMMPQLVKDFVVANIAIERHERLRKNHQLKELYFKKQLKQSVDTKTIIDFYYSEKNKLHGNWRLNTVDEIETPEEKERMEERMKATGLRFVTREPSVPKQSIKSTRSSARVKYQEQEVNGSNGTPETSSSSSSEPSEAGTSFATPSTSQPRINLRIRFNPAKLNSSNPGITISTSPRSPVSESLPSTLSAPPSASVTTRSASSSPKKKRTYSRRSLEQQRNGPKKTYPTRKSRD